MADSKPISQLPDGSQLQSTDYIVASRNGQSVKVPADQLSFADLPTGAALDPTDDLVVNRGGQNYKVPIATVSFNSEIFNVSTTPYAAGFNQYLRVDASSGPIVINLPQVTTAEDLPVVVKKTDSSANIVTINAYAGDNIEGAASNTLSNKGDYLQILPVGDMTWDTFT